MYPKAKIDLFTSTANTSLYSHLFNKTYSFDISKKILIFWDMFKNVLDLRRNEYDLLYDFEPLARSTAVFSRIINPKKSIGFDLPDGNRKNMFTDYVEYNEKAKHIAYIFYKLLGCKETNLSLLEPNITEKENKKIDEYLKDNKIDDYICLNMNASELALQRRWKPENFNRLSRLIFKNHKEYHQFYIGSKSDKEYINAGINDIENDKIINIAGKFNLLETACLLKRAKLFISNDSGPLHLAASVGCPTISFFGPETPKLYAPLSNKAKIFYKNLPCSPCINIRNAKKTHCLNPKCLNFKVTEIYDSVKLAIQSF